MDLQTRKLNVIEYLIRLQDDNMIQEIENLISKSKIHDKNFQQLTEDDLLNRAVKSNTQYESGEFVDQDELEKESKSW
ncbi:MAG: hypothetical protein M0Q90_00680 [Bacteroidales bacterium]|nr:hypothetical protein [Bacteroidales bacterium]